MSKDPDYDHWLQRDLWRIRQAVDLVARYGTFTPGSVLDTVECTLNGGMTITWIAEEYKKPFVRWESKRKVISKALMDMVRDAMDLGELKLFAPSEKQQRYKDRRVRPTHFLRWAQGKGYQIQEDLLPLLESGEPECEQQEPVGNDVPQAPVNRLRSPGDLHLVVDDINQRVAVSGNEGQGKPVIYSRRDLVGRGTATWDLLVLFAKYEGSLEGNNLADVKKRNTSVNRKNLGRDLMEALGLDKSAFIKGRNGVMIFASITLAGGPSTTDAFDRKTVSYDDQATAFLKSHGEDIPVI